MLRWTDWVIHHRKRVIGAWIVVFVLGVAATSNLGSLLTNRFSVPGSDAERGLTITKQRFHERSEGAFTLVVVPNSGTTITDPRFVAAADEAAVRAAGVLKGGKAGPLQPAGTRAVYAQVSTDLENQDASDKTSAVRRAIGSVPGAKTYLSGFPALNHDTQPIYNKDLQRGETIAVPIALLVMASHALYPAMDPYSIASQSQTILQGLLRAQLHFRGAIVTDSIEARAVIRRSDVGTAAVRSVAAGADLVLMTGPGSFRLVFPRLLAEARRSAGFRARVRDAVVHVLALRRRLGLRSPR